MGGWVGGGWVGGWVGVGRWVGGLTTNLAVWWRVARRWRSIRWGSRWGAVVLPPAPSPIAPIPHRSLPHFHRPQNWHQGAAAEEWAPHLAVVGQGRGLAWCYFHHHRSGCTSRTVRGRTARELHSRRWCCQRRVCFYPLPFADPPFSLQEGITNVIAQLLSLVEVVFLVSNSLFCHRRVGRWPSFL